ncbi:2,4-dienoyl-CoA reductase [Oceanobacillus halophilus]|uniref:Peroxisomal trans-2-enoyl-CoA reductase n=1 Tax=Oceanobacillus halophilus TaxID=930130 RepID=A0A495ABW1_9BACI|nr:2,4-dienoyl-CoA reductase [Oceanobacillus halophilus]RKQ35896.1 2,4-dienoyl-CoA reductase [Oceanobacillus halophilus]
MEGKSIIITGGATGLGKAMAMEFARLGADIVIASRNLENLEKAAKEISTFNNKVIVTQTDVRSPEQVEKMVRRAVEENGKIDILVNNAAGNFRVPSLDMSVNAWNSVVDIVLHGTWYCSQEVGRQMVFQKTGGNILNIGSTHVWSGNPGTAHSTAAKAGVLALTKTLAVEWAQENIRVNLIAPGPIEGTGAAEQLWSTPELEKAVLNRIPSGRMGTPKEVAYLASYLVSDYASYVTGSSFVIDGAGHLNKGGV